MTKTSGLRAVLPRLKIRVSRTVSFRLWRRRADDQFIASFPRSGSTWLRTMICNVLVPEGNSDPDVFNALIPGMTIPGVIKINRLPSPRLIQTHACWRPDISRAVYLVRDGRDVIDSLYHYYTTRRGVERPFEDFLVDYLGGAYGRPWHENVVSWLQAGRAHMGPRLHVIKFEDMVKDTERVLQGVLEFLAIDAPAPRVAAAIEAASLDNARRIERQRRGLINSPNASFYRSGAPGARSAVFRDDLDERFTRLSASGLLVAGYLSAARD